MNLMMFQNGDCALQGAVTELKENWTPSNGMQSSSYYLF